MPATQISISRFRSRSLICPADTQIIGLNTKPHEENLSKKNNFKSVQKEIGKIETTYRSSKALKLFAVLSYMKTLKHTPEQWNRHMKSNNGLYLVKLSYDTSYTVSDHFYQVCSTSVINSMNTQSSLNAWTQRTANNVHRWDMILKLLFSHDCNQTVIHSTHPTCLEQVHEVKISEHIHVSFRVSTCNEY